MNKTFDYIIVGAGSAGCVLANRLSADAKNSVLLLEAGGSNRNLLIEMPTALSYPMASDTFNWGYYSQPEPGIDNRQISCPRGKGLGGPSLGARRAQEAATSRSYVQVQAQVQSNAQSTAGAARALA